MAEPAGIAPRTTFEPDPINQGPSPAAARDRLTDLLTRLQSQVPDSIAYRQSLTDYRAQLRDKLPAEAVALARRLGTESPAFREALDRATAGGSPTLRGDRRRALEVAINDRVQRESYGALKARLTVARDQVRGWLDVAADPTALEKTLAIGKFIYQRAGDVRNGLLLDPFDAAKLKARLDHGFTSTSDRQLGRGLVAKGLANVARELEAQVKDPFALAVELGEAGARQLGLRLDWKSGKPSLRPGIDATPLETEFLARHAQQRTSATRGTVASIRATFVATVIHPAAGIGAGLALTGKGRWNAEVLADKRAAAGAVLSDPALIRQARHDREAADFKAAFGAAITVGVGLGGAVLHHSLFHGAAKGAVHSGGHAAGNVAEHTLEEGLKGGVDVAFVAGEVAVKKVVIKGTDSLIDHARR